MRFRPALIATYAATAAAIGCTASNPPPPPVSAPTAQTGVTELQGPPPAAHRAEPVPIAPRPAFRTDVVQAARSNEDYRRVLFTGTKSQVALMTIPAGGDIGPETHLNVEQLIFIASGQGKAVLNGVESPVATGDLVVATPGTRHDVVNTGTQPLRIYTIYTPPNHIEGRIHHTKADADADSADEEFGRLVH
jgi:mannose-6-phosphate isomerase-like protein (cupin superfamily)